MTAHASPMRIVPQSKGLTGQELRREQELANQEEDAWVSRVLDGATLLLVKHEVAHRIDPPMTLFVTAGNLGIDGIFELVDRRLHNRMPVWKSATHVMRTALTGQWCIEAIGRSASKKVRSSMANKGRFPDAMRADGWCFLQGKSWEAHPSIRIAQQADAVDVADGTHGADDAHDADVLAADVADVVAADDDDSEFLD
eukprot:TRINITY_DN68499_c0_g1_i1.p1 TRINITY_DN68499_c0_g1~~TRINITY_DN68499_c0_g1_i1.p1  ORF type:complete len:198 (-),score=31.05 TRINITY_DN68499_c0_g1_i1:269-862(-)